MGKRKTVKNEIPRNEDSTFNPNVCKKVKQSHYRPEQAQRVLRKFRFPDFVTTV